MARAAAAMVARSIGGLGRADDECVDIDGSQAGEARELAADPCLGIRWQPGREVEERRERFLVRLRKLRILVREPPGGQQVEHRRRGIELQ